jgi:hemerythrin-like domain-containing protein/nucleotide-binding universal stress UspA family protein
MYQHLLVPIDGTPLASLTVEDAVEFARSANARITFLHVQADYAATGEGSLLRAMAPAAFATAARGSSNAWLARAAAAAAAAHVACNTVAAVSDHPHQLIHDTASTHQCDLIYMASHGKQTGRGLFAASVSVSLLELATVPVLIARVESNLPLSPEQRALTVIRDEHRSLAAVIHALQAALAQHSEGQGADLQLLQAGLFYLEQFPQRVHHPREEQTLFKLLRQRAAQCNEVIDVLEQQHRTGTATFHALRQALADLVADAPQARASFVRTLQAYADHEWSHMAMEEKQVFPLASQYLQASDWVDVATAFEAHTDPFLGTETEQGFSQVFKRLMDLRVSLVPEEKFDHHHNSGENKS